MTIARALNACATSYTSFTNIAVVTIREAWRIYRTNRYRSNCGAATHATARLDALAFFHSQQFAAMCALCDVNPWRWRELVDIPQPHAHCPCEGCRTDYTAEARVVLNLPRQHRFRFAVGQKHFVQWKHSPHSGYGEIVRIVPQVKRSRKVKYLSAAAYLAACEKAACANGNGRAVALPDTG